MKAARRIEQYQRRGFAVLLSILVIVAIGAVMAVSYVSTARSMAMRQTALDATRRAHQAAEKGIQIALQALENHQQTKALSAGNSADEVWNDVPWGDTNGTIIPISSWNQEKLGSSKDIGNQLSGPSQSDEVGSDIDLPSEVVGIYIRRYDYKDENGISPFNYLPSIYEVFVVGVALKPITSPDGTMVQEIEAKYPLRTLVHVPRDSFFSNDLRTTALNAALQDAIKRGAPADDLAYAAVLTTGNANKYPAYISNQSLIKGSVYSYRPAKIHGTVKGAAIYQEEDSKQPDKKGKHTPTGGYIYSADEDEDEGINTSSLALPTLSPVEYGLNERKIYSLEGVQFQANEFVPSNPESGWSTNCLEPDSMSSQQSGGTPSANGSSSLPPNGSGSTSNGRGANGGTLSGGLGSGNGTSGSSSGSSQISGGQTGSTLTTSNQSTANTSSSLLTMRPADHDVLSTTVGCTDDDSPLVSGNSLQSTANSLSSQSSKSLHSVTAAVVPGYLPDSSYAGLVGYPNKINPANVQVYKPNDPAHSNLTLDAKTGYYGFYGTLVADEITLRDTAQDRGEDYPNVPADFVFTPAMSGFPAIVCRKLNIGTTVNDVPRVLIKGPIIVTESINGQPSSSAGNYLLLYGFLLSNGDGDQLLSSGFDTGWDKTTRHVMESYPNPWDGMQTQTFIMASGPIAKWYGRLRLINHRAYADVNQDGYPDDKWNEPLRGVVGSLPARILRLDENEVELNLPEDFFAEHQDEWPQPASETGG
ncbi:MAG: hypothetical protein HJJLKODD_01757 [Phycisphaerae bacterium]|nr:hypothetical protein [Phycisphaerae bacterium]